SLSVKQLRCCQESRDAQGAGRFHFQVGQGEQQSNRFLNLLFADFNDAFKTLSQYRPVVLTQAQRSHTVGNGLRLGLIRQESASAQGAGGVVGQFRFGAVHSNQTAAGAQAPNDAGCQTAAPNRGNNEIERFPRTSQFFSERCIA